MTLVGRRRRPVILEADPLHGGAGDQVHVSLALEATHLHVPAQSLLVQGSFLSTFQNWVLILSLLFYELQTASITVASLDCLLLHVIREKPSIIPGDSGYPSRSSLRSSAV